MLVSVQLEPLYIITSPVVSDAAQKFLDGQLIGPELLEATLSGLPHLVPLNLIV